MSIKIFYVILAYFCGAIPFAYIIVKIIAKKDIRAVGSGNPGATNVFRTAGKVMGIATLFLDAAKGFVPVYFAFFIDNSFLFSVITAAAAMLGHIFTVFLNFKGGKGIATGLGVCLAIMPLPTLFCVGIFAIVFVSFGYVSLGSVVAAICLPLMVYLTKYADKSLELLIFAFSTSLLVVIKHRNNIKRIKTGNENKINLFKRKK
jgi:glycerol-3-phosphate acyltransferase PlsY